MIDGHMVCGVVMGPLMLRLGAERAEHALTQRHVRATDLAGPPMKDGWCTSIRQNTEMAVSIVGR